MVKETQPGNRLEDEQSKANALLIRMQYVHMSSKERLQAEENCRERKVQSDNGRSR